MTLHPEIKYFISYAAIGTSALNLLVFELPICNHCHFYRSYWYAPPPPVFVIYLFVLLVCVQVELQEVLLKTKGLFAAEVRYLSYRILFGVLSILCTPGNITQEQSQGACLSTLEIEKCVRFKFAMNAALLSSSRGIAATAAASVTRAPSEVPCPTSDVFLSLSLSLRLVSLKRLVLCSGLFVASVSIGVPRRAAATGVIVPPFVSMVANTRMHACVAAEKFVCFSLL